MILLGQQGAIMSGAGGGPDAVDLSGVLEVWEWDSLAAWQESPPNTEVGELSEMELSCANWVADVAGKLNGGVNDGAVNKTNTGGGYVIKHRNPSGGPYTTVASLLDFVGVPAAGSKSFGQTLWFYPTTDPLGTVAVLFCVGGFDTTNSGYQIYMFPSDHPTRPNGLSLIIRGPTYSDVTASTTWTLNAWNFAAITFNANDLEMGISLNGSSFVYNTAAEPPRHQASGYAWPMYGAIHGSTSSYSFTYDYQGRFDQSSQWGAPVGARELLQPINQATADYIYNSGSGILYSAWP